MKTLIIRRQVTQHPPLIKLHNFRSQMPSSSGVRLRSTSEILSDKIKNGYSTRRFLGKSLDEVES